MVLARSLQLYQFGGVSLSASRYTHLCKLMYDPFKDIVLTVLKIQIVPAIILVIGCFYILPSPRWLAEKGRWDECFDVLTRLHGTEAATAEYNQIRAAIHIERESSVGSYKELFSRRYRKRTLIAMATAGLQQLTGTNSILYFAPTLFGKAGLDQQQSFLATGG